MPSGMAVDVDGIAFDHVASASGPSAFRVLLGGFVIASGSAPSSFDTVTNDVTLTDLTGAVTLAFEGTGASSNAGTYRLDNVVLSGRLRVVPIAPAGLLLAPALGIVSLARRRQRHVVAASDSS